MKKFFAVIVGYISGTFEEIAEAIEAGDTSRAIKKAITLLINALCVVGFFTLVIALLYAGRKAILAVVAPIAMIAVLVKSYQLNHPGTSTPVTSVPQPGTIELARTRAEKMYPLLTQTAFLLLSDLCRYLPGLVKPFSLGDVVPKVHYEITASFVIINHFIIAKGDCEADHQTIQNILETAIDQHLEAHDLPLSIPANYTSADGEIYPSLMIDKIHDFSTFYRVDLVITNEAQITRLKTPKKDSATSGVIIHDEDFD